VLFVSLPLKEKSERGRKIGLGGYDVDESRLIDDDSSKVAENA
jgi:hypothetical protein